MCDTTLAGYCAEASQVKHAGRQYAPAKSKVKVCEWEDGRLAIRYRGQTMQWEELAQRPETSRAAKAESKSGPYRGTPPTAGHPWKQSYQKMKVYRPPVEENVRTGQAIACASP